MKFLPIATAGLVVLLTGCAGTLNSRLQPDIPTNVPATTATPPLATKPATPDSDSLNLRSSREIIRPKPAPAPATSLRGDAVPLTTVDTFQSSRTVAAIAPPADLWERIRRG